MSPEAAGLCQAVMVFDTFQEHSTVAVDFSAALDAPAMLRWPMPSEVPWTQVDVEEWQASYQPVGALDSSTAWLKAFGNNLEQSLHGYVHGLPGKCLPKSCFIRCQHLSPVEQQKVPRPPRASRPGEEEIRHSLLCKEVQNWFRQLRRLQSLRHAVVAAKTTPAADLYRVQLWRSILGGKGFQDSFQCWWLIRPIKLQGSPPALPSLLPSAAHVTLIFEDFRENYRRLESWHLRRRHEVLKHRHAKSKTQLYHGLRAESPGQVDCLTVHRTYTVLEVEGPSASLDRPPDLRGHSTWKLNAEPVDVAFVEEVTCSFDGEARPQPGDEVEQVQWLASHEDLVQEFLSLWQPRWQKVPSQSDWTRITAFAAAFLPRLDFALPLISVPQWRKLSAGLSLGLPGARMQLPSRISKRCLRRRSRNC